jgi:hypothetical protein
MEKKLGRGPGSLQMQRIRRWRNATVSFLGRLKYAIVELEGVSVSRSNNAMSQTTDGKSNASKASSKQPALRQFEGKPLQEASIETREARKSSSSAKSNRQKTPRSPQIVKSRDSPDESHTTNGDQTHKSLVRRYAVGTKVKKLVKPGRGSRQEPQRSPSIKRIDRGFRSRQDAVRYLRLSVETKNLLPEHELLEASGKRQQAQGRWWTRHNDAKVGRDELWQALQGNLTQATPTAANTIPGGDMKPSDELVGQAGRMFGLGTRNAPNSEASDDLQDAGEVLVSKDAESHGSRIRRYVPSKSPTKPGNEGYEPLR